MGSFERMLWARGCLRLLDRLMSSLLWLCAPVMIVQLHKFWLKFPQRHDSAVSVDAVDVEVGYWLGGGGAKGEGYGGRLSWTRMSASLFWSQLSEDGFALHGVLQHFWNVQQLVRWDDPEHSVVDGERIVLVPLGK